ncbi:GH25 family lysozyme M1 (1,4-beta-N-acetylmuramidase) [Paraburkholderia sp. MM5496-R1]
MVDVELLPNNVSVDQAVASLQFFLSIVEEGSGKAPIIYTYPSFWTHGMANASLFTKQHLWIANYGTKRVDGGFEPRGIAPIIPGGWPTFSIWQNAVQPGVPGIQTLVDRDVVLLPSGVDLATFLTRPRDDPASP